MKRLWTAPLQSSSHYFCLTENYCTNTNLQRLMADLVERTNHLEGSLSGNLVITWPAAAARKRW